MVVKDELEPLFESTIFGIIIMKPSSEIISINETAIDLIGFKKEDEHFFELLDNRSGISLKNVLNPSFKGHERITATSYRTGKKIELDISNSSIENNPVWTILIKDISERIELKQKIEEQQTEIEEVETELEKEQELNDLKTRFISIASHEFRTPLTGILSSINLVERYYKADENTWQNSPYKEKVEKHFSKINQSVDLLTQIMNQFLSISRIEENSLNFKKEQFNLKQLLFDIVENTRTTAKKKQEVKIEFSGLTEFYSDKEILSIILRNLLTNALKYSFEETTVHVKVDNQEDSLTISVKDNGIGIPEKDKKHIFRRFYRAQNASDFQGTGLGLNIIKNYIESLGGKIWLESIEHKGSTFHVQFNK